VNFEVSMPTLKAGNIGDSHHGFFKDACRYGIDGRIWGLSYHLIKLYRTQTRGEYCLKGSNIQYNLGFLMSTMSSKAVAMFNPPRTSLYSIDIRHILLCKISIDLVDFLESNVINPALEVFRVLLSTNRILSSLAIYGFCSVSFFSLLQWYLFVMYLQ